MSGEGDKRIKVIAGTTGRSFGSESAAVAVQSVSDAKLYVELKATFYDFCGQQLVKTFTYTVPPRGKVGGSPFFDGFEFSPKCEGSKKYGDKFVTRLSNVKLELVSIKEVGTGNKAVTLKALKCDDLVQYRDKKLLIQWDKQRAKYQVRAELVNDIKKQKETLQRSSRAATTDLHIITLTLKTAANTIEDLIAVSSPQGHLLKTAREAGKKAVTRVAVYEAIKKGDKALEALSAEQVEKTIAIQALTELGKLGNILSLVKNFHDNINTWADYQKLKEDVNKQMAAFDRAIEKYNGQLAKSMAGFEEINQYKEYIDAYLAENCKGPGSTKNQ